MRLLGIYSENVRYNHCKHVALWVMAVFNTMLKLVTLTGYSQIEYCIFRLTATFKVITSF